MVQAGEELTLIVEDASLRLDKLLAQRLEGMSRSALQNLISGGFVTAGGKALAKSAKLFPPPVLPESPRPFSRPG